ncbi:MAG: hypothetical protein H0V14_11615 [Chitinophagaceae bacterium]|jgi:hypothetical protein|nr:hypothetical protein [Chitinophagaceae bacterium]
MKYAFILLLILVLIAFRKQETGFEKLYILEGTWKTETRRGVIYEEWKKESATLMKGKSYKLKDADTLLLENISLRRNGKDVFYIPVTINQNNQKPVKFKMASSVNNKFVFENPAHDYPKRIVYEIVNADSVHAFIDDGNDASGKRMHFYYSRIKE